MALLTDVQRAALHAQLMADLSSERSIVPITKADLRAAINATDAWIDQNAASYNTAIPQPARNALTAKQKLALFLYVARQRYLVSP
jgi:hypothetical protein